MTASFPFHSVIFSLLSQYSTALEFSWLQSLAFHGKELCHEVSTLSSLLPNHSGSLVVTETLFHFFLAISQSDKQENF